VCAGWHTAGSLRRGRGDDLATSMSLPPRPCGQNHNTFHRAPESAEGARSRWHQGIGPVRKSRRNKAGRPSSPGRARNTEPHCSISPVRKDHNVALRALAQKQGLKLSEYGLFPW